MVSLAQRWAKRHDLFFAKSDADPRAAEQVLKERPFYYLGEEWTPTKDQVTQARKRQEARRKTLATGWRRLMGSAEFEIARAAIVCATDRVHGGDPDVTHTDRMIRTLAFDSEAEIFVRNL